MTTRFALKAATEDLHRELDSLLSRLNLSDADDYSRFLDFHARSLPAVEGELAAAGLDALLQGWSEQRRSAAIEADLAELGQAMPIPSPAPTVRTTAEMLGIAYVVEGSRLGSRVLRRQVGDELPTAFLSDGGSLGTWPALVAEMDRHLYSDELVGEAKQAARRCFAWFLSVAHEAGIQ